MKLLIGENLKRLRHEHDITQEELAHRLGVSYQSVSRWENGTCYPDMELLPLISHIFSVSLDSLLGMDKQKLYLAYEELERELEEIITNDENNDERFIEIFREARRIYQQIVDTNDNDEQERINLQTIYFATLFDESGKFNNPEILDEFRILAEEVINNPKTHKQAKRVFIESLITVENEENSEKTLDKYAVEHDISRDNLLYNRYMYRNDYDRMEYYRQAVFVNKVTDFCYGYTHFIPENIKRPCLDLQKTANEFILYHIQAIQNIKPNPDFPVSGNGEVNFWLSKIVWTGMRYACNCASTDMPNEAFSAINDVLSLCEKAFSLPDGTELFANSPFIPTYSVKLTHKWEDNEDGTEILYIRIPLKKAFSDGLRTDLCYDILTRESGWEWFDPIRNDPRYAECVKRAKNLIVTRIKN